MSTVFSRIVLKQWWPVVLLAVAAVAYAHLPPGVAPPADLGTGIGDAAAHGVAFCLFTLAVLLTRPLRRLDFAGLWALPALVLFAGVVEWSQLLVGRACQLGDWLGGALGVGLAGLAWFTVRHMDLYRGWVSGRTGQGRDR